MGSIVYAVTVTDKKCQQFGEFKVVLNTTQVMTTMSQYEEHYVA